MSSGSPVLGLILIGYIFKVAASMLSERAIRKITEYNRSVCCHAMATTKKMKYYVIVIDGYGGLVMHVGCEMERLIFRVFILS